MNGGNVRSGIQAADVYPADHFQVFLDSCAKTIEDVCARNVAKLQRAEKHASDALEDSMKSLLAIACRARTGVDSRRKRAVGDVELVGGAHQSNVSCCSHKASEGLTLPRREPMKAFSLERTGLPGLTGPVFMHKTQMSRTATLVICRWPN